MVVSATAGAWSRRRNALAAFGLALLVVAGCSSGEGAPTEAAPSVGAAAGGSGMAMGAAPECPATADVARPPERVITMDAAAAAFLIELGMGDRVIGTSGTDFVGDYGGEVRAALDEIPVLDERVANRETVIAAKPDLVTGISVYELGSFAGSPTPQQLRDNGIVPLTACTATTGETTSIDPTYAYITELARVFGVPERGQELIASLKQQLPTAPLRDVPVLALSSVPAGGAGITTSGGSSLVNGVITVAGGRNVAATVTGEFATLSAEQVTAADPEVIVAVSGFGDETPDQLVAGIRSSPLLANTTAVRRNRIVAVPQTILYSPSLLNPRAVALIAAAVTAAT